MGNKCGTCFTNTSSTDEAEDALLGNVIEDRREEVETTTASSHRGRRRRRAANNTAAAGAPRGPPPPYQVSQVHPFYMLSEDQRVQIIARITLIQSLPVGRYEMNKKMPPLLMGEATNSSSNGSNNEKKMDKSDSTRECPICMNDFLPGEVIRLLPCMHFYHIRCIDDWLMRAITCPTCVQRVDTVPYTSSTHLPHPSQRQHNRTNSGVSVQRSSDSVTPPPSSVTLPISSVTPPTSPSPSQLSQQQQPFLTNVEIH